MVCKLCLNKAVKNRRLGHLLLREPQLWSFATVSAKSLWEKSDILKDWAKALIFKGAFPTSGIGMTWELARNAYSLVPPPLTKPETLGTDAFNLLQQVLQVNLIPAKV